MSRSFRLGRGRKRVAEHSSAISNLAGSSRKMISCERSALAALIGQSQTDSLPLVAQTAIPHLRFAFGTRSKLMYAPPTSRLWQNMRHLILASLSPFRSLTNGLCTWPLLVTTAKRVSSCSWVPAGPNADEKFFFR